MLGVNAIKCAVGAAMLAGVTANQAVADESCTEEQKLLASDGSSSDYFGQSVAISGNVAIVGADGDDPQGNSSGSAYVYLYDGVSWGQEHKLVASDAEASDQFGWAVGAGGNVVIVGALLSDDHGSESGSAYVYRYVDGAWGAGQKLLAWDAEAGDAFGVSVAVAGDVVVIGAQNDDDIAPNAGSVYVFRYDHDVAEWLPDQKLLAPGGEQSDRFGSSVSVDGSVLIGGAYLHDTVGGGGAAGAAYVFRHDGAEWVYEQRLEASDGDYLDHFGREVSISGDLAVVGAPDDDDLGDNAGSAYVFRYDADAGAWTEEQKLLGTEVVEGDKFGESVSISGNQVIVGAYLADDNGSGSGAAYLCRYDGDWSPVEQLLAGDGSSGDRFGCAVSISGNAAVVGAYLDGFGSAYVYRCGSDTPGDVNGDGAVDVLDLVDVILDWGPCPGCPTDLNGDGVVDVLDLIEVVLGWS